MRTITRVTQQKRPGRYNIYLDDDYGFAVDEKILIQFDLFKGTTLDDEQLAEVEAAEFEQKAYQKGLIYATGQLRSSQQVAEKLRQAEFPPHVIERVLERLTNAQVLDDTAFAEGYVAGIMRSGKLGPKGVIYKLKQWGIDQNTILDAVDAYDDETQSEHLVTQVERLLEKHSNQSIYIAKQKTTQKLLQDGFDQRLIKHALADYFETHGVDADEEAEKLDRDAQKVVNRYRQYTGWEFTKRVKQALYRKGYQLDAIDRWLRAFEREKDEE
ncbi:RecX family transcriptional regulator [Weissella ceti]|uniref:Regulatory protein RecX n=1 Tax=Weissella ceti TaxID=759620 RepID=A0ABT3E2C1_9LACO|nr:RecX family transcriptional regulator [Weissella ceti]MCW0952560.1 RecX family transcriptional regulator [Weissella ceti]QVK11776.1 RecX family transcriptional regulator [Weissella ceti]